MPWGKLIASRTVWALWGQYFFMSYSWYFYITWFPTYLKESFVDLSDLHRALLACVPLFFGGLGSLACGLCSGMIDRKLQSTAKTRRLLGFVGMALAGLMLLISIKMQLPVAAVIAIGMAAFPDRPVQGVEMAANEPAISQMGGTGWLLPYQSMKAGSRTPSAVQRPGRAYRCGLPA